MNSKNIILYLIAYAAILVWLLTGCTTTKYVTVPEVHTEYINHADTFVQRDTIIDHQQTVVCEVDSATMAKFGIELKNKERAWLIENSRLKQQISVFEKSKSDTVLVRDTIPKPYPVPEYVEKPLTWWQKLRLNLGNIMMAIIGIAAIYGAMKLYVKLKP